MKDWNIKMIESLTEKEADALASGKTTIKGHDIYFIDFAGYFGFSTVVFYDGAHIKYANDYELHHKGKTRDELKAWYIDALTNKLFTDDEITGAVADYDEYTRKEYFLRNLYPLRVDYISAFLVGATDAEVKEMDRKKRGCVYDPIGFCFVKDPEFVKKHVALYRALLDAKRDAENSSEYMKEAFLREMYNHEYAYNWQADYDVLSVFGKLDYNDDLNGYFKQLNFTPDKIRAYIEARNEYMRNAGF